MMTCDEFRQASGAAPADDAEERVQHAASCADCRSYQQGLRTFDATLARAMAVPVPPLTLPELPAADDDSNVAVLPRRRMGMPAWFAMAAGIALAGYFGLLMLANEPQLTLAEDVIAHMAHEEDSRVVTDVAVPEPTLAGVVSKDVAEMGPGIGLITYARSCVIHGHTVPHLVMQGENGPITLILLPEEQIEAAIPLEGGGFHGVILPVGKGSIAVVGEAGENLRDIGNRVVDAVKWST